MKSIASERAKANTADEVCAGRMTAQERTIGAKM
jgi:hypothetical protein